MSKISFWRTSFGAKELKQVKKAISSEQISMGKLTKKFEAKISNLLKVPYVLATTSGSVAVLMACIALGVKKGDEVIVPNRTWICDANAPEILGAKTVLVDCNKENPNISIEDLKKKITRKTKAIICVHLNGRSADIKGLKKLSKKYKIPLIEDACQAFYSKNNEGFLGTQSDIGFFSLGITKIISTGQGGVLVTKNKELYEKLKIIRNNGTKEVFEPRYLSVGSNFKFTDIQAAIGIAQLDKIKERAKHLKEIYKTYTMELKLEVIPVDLSKEIPLYVEVLCDNRKSLVGFLKSKKIETRPSIPNLNSASYLKNKGKFPNSDFFEKRALFLPCGPAQSLLNVKKVINYINMKGG